MSDGWQRQAPEVRQAKRRQEEARQEDTGQEGRRKEEVRPEEARQEKTRQRKRQEETREDKGDSVPKQAILHYTRPQTHKRSFGSTKAAATSAVDNLLLVHLMHGSTLVYIYIYIITQ